MQNDYFYIKSINDILFNNHVTEHFSKDTLKKKSKDSLVINPCEIMKKDLGLGHLGFATGKLLRSVFKDYLILDDIYEFFNTYTQSKVSRHAIIKYANDQRQIAVYKYGYKDAPTREQKIALRWVENENIVNHPCFFLYSKDVQACLAKNMKLKYYLRYERRATEKKVNYRQM